MSSKWDFWRAQLDGETPETTPGTPHAGFYVLKRRWTVDNTDPNRRPGDPRKKVCKAELPVAIWFDGGWHAVIGKEEYYRDTERIDDIFSRCCRNAIAHDVYERMRHEDERSDRPDFNCAGEGAGGNSEPGEGRAEPTL